MLNNSSTLLTCSQSHKIHQASPPPPHYTVTNTLIKHHSPWFKSGRKKKKSKFESCCCLAERHADRRTQDHFRSLSQPEICTRTLKYAHLPGEVYVSSPYFRHTSCSVCVLCSVKSPFLLRTSPQWHPHPLTHRHDKAPLAPLFHPPSTTQTPPTFISTSRADGTLISVTLKEMGFFTLPSKEQFPNSGRKLATKKEKKWWSERDMDDRGWYMWDYKPINTPDETIKKLREEKGEMGTSDSSY